MSNYIVFTYQHTCEKGYPAYILNSAPFKAVKKKNANGKIKLPFLGEGYYLWEENIDAANLWGAKHYNGNYSIVEYVDLTINKDELLDFLDRRSLKYFNELREEFLKKRPESKKWKLGFWIEFLKKLNISQPGIFPFNYIRADENLPSEIENNKIKVKIQFAEGLEYYTYLSPLLIICVINKKNLTFKHRQIPKNN